MSPRATNFDPVAGIYPWAEYLALGPLLQRTRTHFLPQLDDRRNAFVLGDGDGRFLAALLRRNPQIRATTVDSSARMLALLAQRCSFASSRLTTRQASILDLTPPPGTDLITSHFVLDCFEQADVHAIVQRLSAVEPGTLWLLSDFGISHRGPLKPFAALYIRALYLAFAVLTGLRVRKLPNPQAALQRAGFLRLAHHEKLHGFLYTELWQRNSASAPHIHSSMATEDSTPPPIDAIPDPEPAVPSLAEPDPAVYHHDIRKPESKSKTT